MITTTLAAATPAAFARGRPASSLAAEQPLSAPTFPRWKGTADHLSSATLAALVALLAVLAALVAPGIASGLDGSPGGHASVVGAASAEAHPALRSPDLETRVRASDDADGTHVGVNSADLGILHPGSDVFYDQLASGWLVAPRAPALSGSGPAPGVLEVSPRVRSTAAFENYSPSGGGVEFVFDPSTQRLAVGSPHPTAGLKGSPHQQLAQSIGGGDGVVGGVFQRGPNGQMLTNEFSGHYWRNWDASTRGAFSDFMSSYGFDHMHSTGFP